MIIDGRAIAQRLRDRVKTDVEAFVAEQGRPPGLATLLIGDDPASAVYVASKRKASKEVGIESFHHPLSAEVSRDEVPRDGVPRDDVSPVDRAPAAGLAPGSEPLLTKPTTPAADSGPGYSWALTEKFGSESPPMVCSTPPLYLVTTSTCPSNSTQSPGRGA